MAVAPIHLQMKASYMHPSSKRGKPAQSDGEPVFLIAVSRVILSIYGGSVLLFSTFSEVPRLTLTTDISIVFLLPTKSNQAPGFLGEFPFSRSSLSGPHGIEKGRN